MGPGTSGESLLKSRPNHEDRRGVINTGRWYFGSHFWRGPIISDRQVLIRPGSNRTIVYSSQFGGSVLWSPCVKPSLLNLNHAPDQRSEQAGSRRTFRTRDGTLTGEVGRRPEERPVGSRYNPDFSLRPGVSRIVSTP